MKRQPVLWAKGSASVTGHVERAACSSVVPRAACFPAHCTRQLPCTLSHATTRISPRLSSLSSTSSSLPGSSWPGARSAGSDAMATCGVWREPGQGQVHKFRACAAALSGPGLLHACACSSELHARHAFLCFPARTSTSSSLGRSSSPYSTTTGGLAAAGCLLSWGGS